VHSHNLSQCLILCIADFISLFLQRVGEVQNQDGTASICQEAYNKTLAEHHTWVIRKAAGVAMYAMPNKENLLIKAGLFKICLKLSSLIKIIYHFSYFAEIRKKLLWLKKRCLKC
jgi:hypothetical protein